MCDFDSVVDDYAYYDSDDIDGDGDDWFGGCCVVDGDTYWHY